MLHSWDALDPTSFEPSGAITAAFLRAGVKDLRSAAQYIGNLPYGRNTHPEDPLIVLLERRGTCSTKHALLHRLAMEQGFAIALILGIYEMSEHNTPGVGDILRKHGLNMLPEAHCYLRIAEKRIDVTRQVPAQPISHFLHEEEIDPVEITEYKTARHKQFLTTWISGNSGLGGRSLAEVWEIREECIASLSR